MRLISDVETKMVSGGGYLTSDSFDGGGGGGGMCWGSDFQDSCDVTTVYIYGGIENPNWVNVGSALGALGGALMAAATLPVTAGVAIGAAVVIVGALIVAHQP
jgi:hypothetical protein